MALRLFARIQAKQREPRQEPPSSGETLTIRQLMASAQAAPRTVSQADSAFVQQAADYSMRLRAELDLDATEPAGRRSVPEPGAHASVQEEVSSRASGP
jgi:hypothetical protein